MNFALKTRNFVFKTRNCVSKTRNFALKTRNVVFKMMDFADLRSQLEGERMKSRGQEGARICDKKTTKRRILSLKTLCFVA